MRILTASLVLAATAFVSAAAHAQSYPSKPVRFLVGFAPGGGVDTVARTLAPKMGEALGQPVVIENKPGAGGTLAADAAATADPDGYTMLFGETGLLIAPAIYDKVTFDPIKSFAAVAPVAVVHLALVVHPQVAANDAAQLIKDLKDKRQRFLYGSPGVGTVQHLAGEMFKKAAGVEMEHAPFKGAAPALTALVGGQIPIAVVSAPPALAQAKGGKAKLLAVTSGKRMEGAPEIPALAETLPGFDAAPSIFVLAPAKVPDAIVAKVNQAVAAALADVGVREALGKIGADVAKPTTQAAFAQELAKDFQRWTVVARESGAKAE